MTEPARIGDILVRRELVDSHVVRRALAEQPVKQQRLVSMLITQTLIEPDDGALALSEQTGYPAVLEHDLETRTQKLANVIPLDLVQMWAVIPLARAVNGLLMICARDPSPMLAHALREALAEPVALAIAPALYVERIARALCRVPPETAPAFLQATIDRPPPGWARRSAGEFLASPLHPAFDPAFDPAAAAPSLQLELDPPSSPSVIELDAADLLSESGLALPDDSPSSEPALILSTLSAEEREVVMIPPATDDDAPYEIAESTPPPIALSSIGISVPPSDPATVILDPALDAPDPASVPVSYAPRALPKSMAIPRVADSIDAGWEDDVSRSDVPSPPSFHAPDDSAELLPPVARTSTAAAFVHQPAITTASSIGIQPPVAPTADGSQPLTATGTNPMLPALPPLPPLAGSGPGKDIERALSRTNAERLALKHAGGHWTSVALLAVDGEQVRGNRGQGPRLAAITGHAIAFAESALLRAAQAGEPTTVTAAGDPDPLLALLGLPAMAAPVLADDVLVAIIAGGEPTGELAPAVERLTLVAGALGVAYRRFR